MNEESIPRYVERVGAGECPPLASCKPLSEDDQLRQRTMFALKVLDDDGGALLETCEREFGVTMDAAFGPILAELEGVGLLEREPDRVRLSPVGRLFADEVLERFYTAEMLARIRGRMSVRELPTRPPSRTT
jgi:coproporphyrinogen III oxidase-like Fe-S oxidoreductase